MGMFDTIYVEKKLPLTKELKKLPIDWKNIDWQTKDLENLLNYYTITSKGKLMEHKTDGYWKPLPKDQQTDWCDQEFIETKEWKEEIKDFHGIIRFYAFEDVESTKENWWIEFKAYFSYGKLDKIVLHKAYSEPYDSLKHEKLLLKIQEHNNHPWTKTKRILAKFGWNWFWIKVSKGIRKIVEMLNSWVRLINKYFL